MRSFTFPRSGSSASSEPRVFAQRCPNELRMLATGGGQHGGGLARSGALLALCAVLGGCAKAHGRIEGPPLYVHLCDAMPAADREAWGAAAGDINAELEEPVLWVGHGAPIGCSTVDVCPSSALRAGAETRIGSCAITVRYAPGSAHEVAPRELGSILDELRADEPRSAALDDALQIVGWQIATERGNSCLNTGLPIVDKI